jgi:hypothetical protein
MAEPHREVEVPEFWILDRSTYEAIVVARRRNHLSVKGWFTAKTLQDAADY